MYSNPVQDCTLVSALLCLYQKHCHATVGAAAAAAVVAAAAAAVVAAAAAAAEALASTVEP